MVEQVTDRVHQRYERTPEGVLCLDVAAERPADLYNHFDRNAPFVRRDLDHDLVDYLIESATELSPRPFVVRFTFAQETDPAVFTRIRNSIANFFGYRVAQERQELRRMLAKSGVFLLVGIGILAASVWVNQRLGPEPSVTANVIAQGLNISAWVALWEALAVLVIEWYPYHKQIGIYRKLAKAPVLFR